MMNCPDELVSTGTWKQEGNTIILSTDDAPEVTIKYGDTKSDSIQVHIYYKDDSNTIGAVYNCRINNSYILPKDSIQIIGANKIVVNRQLFETISFTLGSFCGSSNLQFDHNELIHAKEIAIYVSKNSIGADFKNVRWKIKRNRLYNERNTIYKKTNKKRFQLE